MNITSTLVRGSDDHYYPGELQCVFSLEEKDIATLKWKVTWNYVYCSLHSAVQFSEIILDFIKYQFFVLGSKD